MKRRRERVVETPLAPALVDWFCGDDAAFERHSEEERFDALVMPHGEHERLAHTYLEWLIGEAERRRLPRPCPAEEWAKWYRPDESDV